MDISRLDKQLTQTVEQLVETVELLEKMIDSIRQQNQVLTTRIAALETASRQTATAIISPVSEDIPKSLGATKKNIGQTIN